VAHGRTGNTNHLRQCHGLLPRRTGQHHPGEAGSRPRPRVRGPANRFPPQAAPFRRAHLTHAAAPFAYEENIRYLAPPAATTPTDYPSNRRSDVRGLHRDVAGRHAVPDAGRARRTSLALSGTREAGSWSAAGDWPSWRESCASRGAGMRRSSGCTRKTSWSHSDTIRFANIVFLAQARH
jgi:hypothetical protein